MNEERDVLTPDEQRARDAVRGLAPPRAEPAFRARLKADFVSGAIASTRPRVVVLRPWYARPAFAWVAVPVAAAAALLLVPVLNRGPAWEMTRLTGDGIAVVDGRPIPLGHADQLARRIRPGVRVELPEGAVLELAVPGTLALELSHGADVTVPARPGRWFAREVSTEARSGEMRIATGPAFHGATLRIATLEARVEVTGTALAVICEPEGTCVCVEEGTVQVGEKAGPMVAVPAGMRRYVYNDARAPVLAPMRPEEHEALPKLKTSESLTPR